MSTSMPERPLAERLEDRIAALEAQLRQIFDIMRRSAEAAELPDFMPEPAAPLRLVR